MKWLLQSTERGVVTRGFYIYHNVYTDHMVI